MCWESIHTPILSIAEERVPIFKITHKGLISYYQNFQYELNKEYSMKLESPIIESYNSSTSLIHCRIFKGFHSYSPQKIKIFPTYINEFMVIVNHTVLEVYDNDTTIKVDGYLPIGTKYYINELGEIVSDKIVLTKTERV